MSADQSEQGSGRALPSSAIGSQVRGQAVWAGIAAGAMLYFGLTKGFSTDLSGQILKLTLVCGGVSMAASALLLLSGSAFALLFDGIAAMVIGVALALCGVLWFGFVRSLDLVGVLDLVFGYLFFTSGRRSYRDYFRLTSDPDEAPADLPQTPPPAEPAAPASPPEPENVPEGYLSSFADPTESNAPDA